MNATGAHSLGGDLESMLVPTEWTDRDDDIVVQAKIDMEMGLGVKYELD